MKDLIEVLKDKVPGFKRLELGPASEYNNGFGYVDHQSSGLTTGEDVEDLIFNNAKIIIIDNDNGCNYEDYYEPEEWEKGGHPHKYKSVFALISPHSANRPNEPPQSVRIYSRACSTMSAKRSVSLLPSA